MKRVIVAFIRGFIADFTVPRCVYCRTRQDRPASVCRGAHSISFYHTWET